MYTLRGEWHPAEASAGGAQDGGAVRLVKEYTSPSLAGVAIRYEGRLVRLRRSSAARRVAARAAVALGARLTVIARVRSRGRRTACGCSPARGATRRRARTASSRRCARRRRRTARALPQAHHHELRSGMDAARDIRAGLCAHTHAASCATCSYSRPASPIARPPLLSLCGAPHDFAARVACKPRCCGAMWACDGMGEMRWRLVCWCGVGFRLEPKKVVDSLGMKPARGKQQ